MIFHLFIANKIKSNYI